MLAVTVALPLFGSPQFVFLLLSPVVVDLNLAAQRQQILVAWNDTAGDYPQGKCVHELFEEQARRTPDAIALVAGDLSLSFAELDARAGRLARSLRARGVGPDVIVADISMPNLNGIEALAQLKKDDPGVKVVFLTMHQEVAYARRALEAGAAGYVLKHAAATELIQGLRAALDGGTFVSPRTARRSAKSCRRWITPR